MQLYFNFFNHSLIDDHLQYTFVYSLPLETVVPSGWIPKAKLLGQGFVQFYSQWFNTSKVYFSFMLQGLVGDLAPPSPSGALAEGGALTVLLLHQKRLMASLVTSTEDRVGNEVFFFRGDTPFFCSWSVGLH